MHKHFMLAALQQAWFGRGLCAPNPAVGAVLVQDDQIIAADWHKGAGTAHAERLVMEHLPDRRDNLRLYVTLEPCNHWGRTPPCILAIIASGIKQVYFAYRDPNPVVAVNDTPSLLAEQGINAVYYPLPEIDRFYESYQYWTRSHRPWLTAKLAQSFDGKIADPGGKPRPLSNAACAAFTHQQRRHSDLILTTARTVIQDDPQLNARDEHGVLAKAVAILDADLSVPAKARVISCAKRIHLFHAADKPVVNPIPNVQYHALPCQDGCLDLPAVLGTIGQLGYHDVWLEAGGRLFTALHEQKLVQRSYLYLAPAILGAKAIDAYPGYNFFEQTHQLTWQAKEDNMIACFDWQESRCLPD